MNDLNNINPGNIQNWNQMDELFALVERKNILEAINKTDTEKFLLFTKMIRIANTLKKLRSSIQK